MKKEYLSGLKFAIVGVSNTAVDMIIFAILTYLLNWSPYPSQIISYSCGTFNSYVFNRSWTFKTTQKFFSKQMLLFILVNLLVLMFTSLTIWIASEKLLLPLIIAKIISVLAGLVLNFILNKLFVFKV